MQNETLQNITVESSFNYNASQLPSKLVAIVADNAEVEAVSEGTASLIFAETPFYAEMGGQAGPWSNLGCCRKRRSDCDRRSKSTKWTTTSYC